MLANKGMKQTKPSILELRSLSPVFGGLSREPRGLTAKRLYTFTPQDERAGYGI